MDIEIFKNGFVLINHNIVCLRHYKDMSIHKPSYHFGHDKNSLLAED